MCSWWPDGFWYSGIVVGARALQRETSERSDGDFFLVQFPNNSRLWTDAGRVVVDVPPADVGVLSCGDRVLCAQEDAEGGGGVRFAPAQIVSLPSSRAKSGEVTLRCGDRETAVPLALIRLLPTV